MATILVIDDDPSFRRVIEFQLKGAGYKVMVASNGQEGLQFFNEQLCDLVLTDLQMKSASGLVVLREIKKQSPDTPVIVITGFGSIDSAVEAMKAGAFHYLTKPLNGDELLHTVGNALKLAGLVTENRYLREAVSEAFKFEGIVGTSSSMRRLIEKASQLARVDTTVLISGESGTGKEILAKAIHFNGTRNRKPFIVINCGTIPEALLESELFGHRKGAFTGAVSNKIGKFEAAAGGTIFMDEIADLPLALQVKVLRVVQENEIDVVGENLPRKVDVRIIAASHRDLRQMVADGQFRHDLYYRLNVAPLNLPALRERREDIPLLARFLVGKIAKRHGMDPLVLNREVLGKLESYSWPGNIRELENVMERLTVFSQGRVPDVGDLPEEIVHPEMVIGKAVLRIPPEGISMADLEKELVETALERNQGNQTRAASFLRISRNVLIYRMQKYRLGPYKDLNADPVQTESAGGEALLMDDDPGDKPLP
jgi:DNA-binding NtrC family response regulator